MLLLLLLPFFPYITVFRFSISSEGALDESPPRSFVPVTILIMLSKYLAGLMLALNVVNTLAAGVQFAGVNIAGFDFGCVTDVRSTHGLLVLELKF